ELLAAAEAFVRAQGARRMRMTVIGIRDTLIAWYRRRGYAPTGEVLPFTYADVPRPDLDFVVLEKAI
ncbi:MAG: GNAT family N-acetyltransferase, partial [Caulobacteraceae bacterium]